MIPFECFPSRRHFIAGVACAATGAAAIGLSSTAYSKDSDLTIVGPKAGFTPEIGTLTSEMAFMRQQVFRSTKGMTQGELDWPMDAKANTIGALLAHLAAIESLYQADTFEGLSKETRPPAFEQKWGVALELGDPARKSIKGNNLDYYLNMLSEARDMTLAEFRKRDDKWLAAVDPKWGWGPTNNYCKWFHVTEHDANHNGQIKLLKARLPGAKPAAE